MNLRSTNVVTIRPMAEPRIEIVDETYLGPPSRKRSRVVPGRSRMVAPLVLFTASAVVSISNIIDGDWPRCIAAAILLAVGCIVALIWAP